MKTTALAMAITDSELSDEEASILESGGFSVSRATTPQLTELYEGKGSLYQCHTAAYNHAQVALCWFQFRSKIKGMGSVDRASFLKL